LGAKSATWLRDKSEISSTRGPKRNTTAKKLADPFPTATEMPLVRAGRF
jgi:hypothetical protein